MSTMHTAARSLLGCHVDTGIDLEVWPEVLAFVREVLPRAELDAAGIPRDAAAEAREAGIEARLRVRAGLELAFPDLALEPFRLRP